VKLLAFLGGLLRRRRPTTRHLAAGLWGEQRAARLLRRTGYRIVGRRVRVGRRDEIDIIAARGPVLVFVEVKTRHNEDFGRPIAAVGHAKQRALSRAAIRYLGRLRHKPDYFRFDVIEVVGAADEPAPLVRHIENAFTLDPRYRITW